MLLLMCVFIIQYFYDLIFVPLFLVLVFDVGAVFLLSKGLITEELVLSEVCSLFLKRLLYAVFHSRISLAS